MISVNLAGLHIFTQVTYTGSLPHRWSQCSLIRDVIGFSDTNTIIESA